MDILSLTISYALAFSAARYYNQTISPTANWTVINATTWWSDSPQANQDISVRPVNITWDSAIVTDLKGRLNRNVSYVAPLENVNFTYGFNRDQLANWTKYWGQQYDFNARLSFFNQYPMFKTNIQGLDIFFYRITAKPTQQSQQTVPILMLHGFPAGIREYMDAIPFLTNVDNNRNWVPDLIIPCLPGYGFSGHTNMTGLGAVQTAVIMRSLMLRLGFNQYYVQGGDIGGIIGGHMATLWPEEVLGYHTHWARVLSPTAVLLQAFGAFFPQYIVKNATADRMYPLYDIFTNGIDMSAYLHWQTTRSNTALIAMEDSPSGFLAYMLDIITRLINPNNIHASNGSLNSILSPDTLMDILTTYWLPGTIGTPFRMHAETFNRAQMNLRLDEIQTSVPTWVLQPRYALTYQSPLILRLKYQNLVNVNVLQNGGHFIPLEQPQVFANDVIAAITSFRSSVSS